MAIHKLIEIKRRKFVLTERKVRWLNVAFGSCKYELPKSKSIFCWNGKFLKQKNTKKRRFKWAQLTRQVDQKHSSSLSFHSRGREVFAALWNQPHAIPSTLGTTRPRPSPKSHGLALNWRARILHLLILRNEPNHWPISLYTLARVYKPALLSSVI